MLFMSFLIHLSSYDQFFYCFDHDVGVAVAVTTITTTDVFVVVLLFFFASHSRWHVCFFPLNTRSSKLAHALHLFETIIICFAMKLCLCDYVLHLKTIMIIFFCFMFGTCLNADIWWDYYIACCLLAWCFRQHTNHAGCLRGVRECVSVWVVLLALLFCCVA